MQRNARRSMHIDCSIDLKRALGDPQHARNMSRDARLTAAKIEHCVIRVKGKTMKKANDQYLSDFDDRLRASGHGQAHPIELGLGTLVVAGLGGVLYWLVG
jgi:hypothetical protein